MKRGETQQEALTKHERILQHIQNIEVGNSISVRSLARELGVSEGTAYRAVKEAEKLGIVSTKERIGTVRIEKKHRSHPDRLTFAEVADILDGRVLGGAQGLHKTLHKFVIGAMQIGDMLAYIDADSLLIVGNRENVHRMALLAGAGVLITGGFDTSEEIKQLADERQLPIISSGHDTFTVASLINRAMYDRVIKRKIMLIEEIVTLGRPSELLRARDTVEVFDALQQDTGHARFPVVDDWHRVIGMVTARDVAGSPRDQTIEKLMTRHPITIQPGTTVAAAAHTMASEGIDLLPIVDKQRKLLAVVSRQEVLAALQFANKQTQSGETFDDLIWNRFAVEEGELREGGRVYRGRITPQMSGQLGTLSEGVLTTLMMQGARRLIQEVGKRDHVLESVTTYFVRPIPIDSEIIIVPKLLEMSRKSSKLEIEIEDERGLAAKAMMTAQMIDAY
ncbi:hypothetical protein PA598K_02320 [Paenibacillus sp. 598K]|uniref:DRTGG domain-containing protein n=1 Tax=Paenibacillus sp. 598K TaxID=1117987 RepID=UPI000FF93C37|nr:DRTGG domain-containing protein [Paenibacillus sp. 598K]GBF73992.1 hypothetical protein PA598K_02320 [Paenibacillus sp. 598K]